MATTATGGTIHSAFRRAQTRDGIETR